MATERNLSMYFTLDLLMLAVTVLGFTPRPTPTQSCPLQCATCNLTYSYCTSCRPGYALNNGNCYQCGTNCSVCTYGGYGTTCIQCNNRNGPLSNDPANCRSCSPHCAGCSSAGAGGCDNCDPGFGLTSSYTPTCAPCSPYCSIGCNNTGAGNCDRCDNGTGYQLPNKTCAPCSSYCSAGCLHAGASKCDQCDLGSGLTSTNSCAPCSPNCQAGCNQSGAGKCDQCDPGYGLTTSGSCLRQTCPSQCSTCDSSFTYCTSCHSGYRQFGGTCYGYCGTNCAACSVSYTPICVLCENGYGLTGDNSNNCGACPVNCSTCQKNMNVCTTCDTGYAIFSGNQTCGLIDNCVNNTQCQYGGQCVNGVNTFTCNCTENHYGKYCQYTGQDPCSSSPCQNGGTCQSLNNTYNCTCAPGFTNNSCEIEINECDTLPCHPFGLCVDAINNYTCNCLPGFSYVSDHYCQEINECNVFSQNHPNEPVCMNNGSCQNIINTFYCECPQNKDSVIYGQRCESSMSRDAAPQFFGISKTFGTQSGGSAITFAGVGLTAIPPIGVFFNATAYGLDSLFGYVQNGTLQSESFVVLTPKSYSWYIGLPLSLTVLLSGGSLVPLPSSLNFTYVGNPTITDIQPRTQIAYGGILLTLIGYNFDAVVTTQCTVTLKLTYMNETNNFTMYEQYPPRICSETNQYNITCVLPVFDVFLSTSSSRRRKREALSSEWSPRKRSSHGFHRLTSLIHGSTHFRSRHRYRRDRAPAKFTVGDIHAEMYLNFTLDNYPKYENISKPLPNVTFNIVISRPEIDFTANQDIDPSTDPVNIKGKALLYGVSRSDYSVAIGTGSCNITGVTDNEATCTAPMDEPRVNNDSILHCSIFPEHLAVMVTAASSKYFAFCLKYKPKNQVDIKSLIIGICVGVGGFLLIILVVIIIVVVIRRRKYSVSKEADHRSPKDVDKRRFKEKEGTVGNGDNSVPLEDLENRSEGYLTPREADNSGPYSRRVYLTETSRGDYDTSI